MNPIEDFANEDHYLANLLAPRGVLIKQVGVPSYVDLELPNAIDVDFFPTSQLVHISPKGAKHVSAGLLRLAD